MSLVSMNLQKERDVFSFYRYSKAYKNIKLTLISDTAQSDAGGVILSLLHLG